jgi:phosphoribosylformimino-5-aminoimidazole carboxamide ribotide isomerase
MEGPDTDGTKTFSLSTGLKVILSGGVTSLNDIENAKKTIAENLFGVIIGKAYYEGKLDITEAIKKFQD